MLILSAMLGDVGMKSVLALELNKQFCAVITEKGSVEFLKKDNNKESFDNYLSLKNLKSEITDKLDNEFDNMRGLQKKIVVDLLETIIVVLMSVMLNHSLLPILLGLTTFLTGISIYNIKRIIKTDLKIKSLKKQRHNVSKEIRNIDCQYHVMCKNILEPNDEIIGIDFVKSNILLLPGLLKREMKDNYQKFVMPHAICFDKDLEKKIGNELLYLENIDNYNDVNNVVMENNKKKIIMDVKENVINKNIRELLSLKFQLLDTLNTKKNINQVIKKKDMR